jgi:hypothetical protein
MKSILFYIISVIILLTMQVQAQMGFTIYPSEYQIKAKYLYNFARFVNWPEKSFPDSTTSIVIGIIDDDPFGIDLDKTVEGKQINNRGFKIKRFNNMNGIESCHILFIGSHNIKRRLQILKKLKDHNVLTVGDSPYFVHNGGIINFIFIDKKIRFEINIQAANASGLILSPRLLKLANIIDTTNIEKTFY